MACKRAVHAELLIQARWRVPDDTRQLPKHSEVSRVERPAPVGRVELRELLRIELIGAALVNSPMVVLPTDTREGAADREIRLQHEICARITAEQTRLSQHLRPDHAVDDVAVPPPGEREFEPLS